MRDVVDCYAYRRAGLLQGHPRNTQGWFKQFGHRAGRGGDVARLAQREKTPTVKTRTEEAGRSQRPAFFVGAGVAAAALRSCAAAASRLLGRHRSCQPWLKVFDPLEFPPDSPPEAVTPLEPPQARREPILTLPGALTAYVALLAVIHVVRLLLPFDTDDLVVEMFGFIPKRYDTTLLDVTFPGGAGAKVWSFVSYSLLHANFTHIGFNVLWLLPFGSALARRFGAARFFLFMAVTAAAGALAHLVSHEHAVAPMIGASASVSGAMAAAIRFAFVRGSFLSFSRGDADAAARVPALSLLNALRNRRVLGFLAVWFGVNIIFGIGSIAIGGTEGVSIAWQAHIGGFLAGLMLFSLFDPVPRAPADAASASSPDASHQG
jgi:membrane associated rhomboid family serine protease